MILTCPNCNGQFNVDDTLIGDKGRKVKCSSCTEVWFQEPEHAEPEEEEIEEVLAEIEDTPIEEAVDDFEVDFVDSEEDEIGEDIAEEQPIVESSHKEVSLEHIKRAVGNHAVNARKDNKGTRLGYGIAVCVFCMIFAYLLGSSTAMMKTYPSMQAFYGMFGIHRGIPGKGLVFDQLVVADNGETITVDGRIINLESVAVNVPIIEASLMDATGKSITQWYIQPPADILEGEDNVSFHSVYYKSAHPDDDKDFAVKHKTEHNEKNGHGEEVHKDSTQHVQIRFALLAKIDEADDGNNSVHHQDAPDHQSDHAESSKSHQPASSASHQAPSHASH